MCIRDRPYLWKQFHSNITFNYFGALCNLRVSFPHFLLYTFALKGHWMLFAYPQGKSALLVSYKNVTRKNFEKLDEFSPRNFIRSSLNIATISPCADLLFQISTLHRKAKNITVRKRKVSKTNYHFAEKLVDEVNEGRRVSITRHRQEINDTLTSAVCRMPPSLKRTLSFRVKRFFSWCRKMTLSPIPTRVLRDSACKWETLLLEYFMYAKRGRLRQSSLLFHERMFLSPNSRRSTYQSVQ